MIYVWKESCNLSAKDKNSTFERITHSLRGSDNDYLCVRDICNLCCLSILEVIEMAEKHNAYLMGNSFELYFFSEDNAKNMKADIESKCVSHPHRQLVYSAI